MEMRTTKRLLANLLPILTVCLVPAVAAAQFGQAEPAGQEEGQTQQPQTQQPQTQQPQPRASGPAQQAGVVATVNGDPITRSEVQASMQRHLAQLQAQQQDGQGIDPQIVQKLQPQVVENLIESRLVEQYAVEKGPGVEKEEVKATVDQIKSDLESRESSLDQYLEMRGQTAEVFESRIEGSLAWQKLQQQQMTEENLQRFFEDNKEQFQADDFQQARGQVAGEYVNAIWRQIVAQARPEAEIEVAGAPAAPPAGGGFPPVPSEN